MTPEADAFIDEVLDSSEQPVVMFAFEWCEFCRSVRKMFTAVDIPYRSIDLDSAAYQENDWGGQIRAALDARFGVKTIPQIFVGGRHIGGATETFDAFNDGDLQTMLSANSVIFNRGTEIDPYSLLPTWLHPRQPGNSRTVVLTRAGRPRHKGRVVDRGVTVSPAIFPAARAAISRRRASHPRDQGSQ